MVLSSSQRLDTGHISLGGGRKSAGEVREATTAANEAIAEAYAISKGRGRRLQRGTKTQIGAYPPPLPPGAAPRARTEKKLVIEVTTPTKRKQQRSSSRGEREGDHVRGRMTPRMKKNLEQSRGARTEEQQKGPGAARGAAAEKEKFEPVFFCNYRSARDGLQWLVVSYAAAEKLVDIRVSDLRTKFTLF